MTNKMLSAALACAAGLAAASSAQAETAVLTHVFGGDLNGVSFYRADTVLYSVHGTAFNLDSAQLFELNPWTPGEPGEDTGVITAYRNGQEVFSRAVTFNFGQPQQLKFAWNNIDTVLFQSGASSDGTFLQVSNLAGAGITQAVPEPESYAMLLAGLGVVGFVARRRKA